MGELRNPSDPASQELKTEESKTTIDHNLGALSLATANKKASVVDRNNTNSETSSSSSEEDDDDCDAVDAKIRAGVRFQRTLSFTFHARAAGANIAGEKSKNATDNDSFKKLDDLGSGSGLRLPPWEALLYRGRLYVRVNARQLSEGSREAFVTLLEFAEDVLECGHVVLCVDKASVFGDDVKGKAVARNFLFLGFQPLAQGHEFLPPHSQNLVRHFRIFYS